MFFPLRDDNPHTSQPVTTVAIIGVCCLVWAYQFSLGDGGDAFVYEAGAIPARVAGMASMPEGSGYVPAWATLVTCMFLHGGTMHLLGNMWFLWVFGDNLEHHLGRLQFLLFYLASGIAATAVHVAVDPSSEIPVVGASGAISGVLGAYAVIYPRARVRTYVFLFVFIRQFSLPAAAFLGLWFLGQFMSLGDAGVAWWAHIGGFVVGVIGGAIARRVKGVPSWTESRQPARVPRRRR